MESEVSRSDAESLYSLSESSVGCGDGDLGSIRGMLPNSGPASKVNTNI
jgi:hypothetical protein